MLLNFSLIVFYLSIITLVLFLLGKIIIGHYSHKKHIEKTISKKKKEIRKEQQKKELLDELEDIENDLETEDDSMPAAIKRESIALIRKAEACIHKEDYDAAKKNLIRVLTWDEDHPDANIYLAFVYLQTDNPSKAENLYRRALEKKPNDPKLLTNFSLSLSQQKDPDKIKEAVLALEKAVEVDEKNAERYSNLGQIYFYIGDVYAAIKAFEVAVRLSPRNLEFLFFLADSYLEAKDYPKAKNTFEKILNISPFNEEAKAELDKLTKIGI